MDAGLNKPRVGIEIIGKEYVSFLDLDEPSTETLDLTTVVNNQSKAFVKVFLFKGDSKTLITEFKVMNLPPCEAGYPDIVINGKFDGRKTLTLGIVLNGRTYNSESLSLRKYLPRKARAPVIASFGCALAIGCFLIMYKGYHTGVKKSQKEISRQTGPVESVSRPVIDRTAETTVPRKPPPRAFSIGCRGKIGGAGGYGAGQGEADAGFRLGKCGLHRLFRARQRAAR
jgi:hypothetical protein